MMVGGEGYVTVQRDIWSWPTLARTIWLSMACECLRAASALGGVARIEICPGSNDRLSFVAMHCQAFSARHSE